MELEEPFKVGYLFIPPQTFLRRSWPKRYCALYKSSSYGIQRLEVFDNDGAFLKHSKSPCRIIALTDCVKVTPAPQKQQANVFEVRTRSSCHQFSADTFQDMTEWLGALQAVAFGVSRPSSGLDVTPALIQNVKQEENLLYSSMDEPDVYSVKALNTDAMLRNNLFGEYKLIMTSVSIAIAEDRFQNKVGRTILTWPYRHIRRYGCSKDNFSFEAGRKCVSGEGLFAFGTLDGSVIFQTVDSHVASLKSSQSDVDAPASPFLDDEKNCNVFSFKEALLISKNKNPLQNVSSLGNKMPNENASFEIATEAEKNAVKPVISKPPRKSKQNSYTNVELNKNQITPSKTDTNFSSNIYEEPSDTYEKHVETSNLKFATTNLDQYDGKTDASVLMCEKHSGLSASYEPIYAVLEENSTRSIHLDSLTEKLDDASVSNNTTHAMDDKFHVSEYSDQGSDFYDHLSLKKIDCVRTFAENQISDHIYGKLLPTRPNSSASKLECKNTYGSLKIQTDLLSKENTSSANHSYINVQIPKMKSTSSLQENSFTSQETEPKHFLLNNAEYAKILKSKK